jgi:hypothetical protein
MYIQVTNYKEKVRQEVNLDLVESFTEVKGSNTTVIHFKNSVVTICESIDKVSEKIRQAKKEEYTVGIFQAFIASGTIQSSNYLAIRSGNYAEELLKELKSKGDMNHQKKKKMS